MGLVNRIFLLLLLSFLGSCYLPNFYPCEDFDCLVGFYSEIPDTVLIESLNFHEDLPRTLIYLDDCVMVYVFSLGTRKCVGAIPFLGSFFVKSGFYLDTVLMLSPGDKRHIFDKYGDLMKVSDGIDYYTFCYLEDSMMRTYYMIGPYPIQFRAVLYVEGQPIDSLEYVGTACEEIRPLWQLLDSLGLNYGRFDEP